MSTLFESVSDAEHFYYLVKEYKNKYPKRLTNFFLLPSEITRLCEEKRLSYLSEENRLWFFCEETNFYTCYFFLFEDAPDATQSLLPNLDAKKPISISVIYRQSNPQEALLKIERILIQSGFHFYNKYERMRKKISFINQGIPNKKDIKNNEFTIGFARISDYESIHTIWRSNLDVLSTPLPDEIELKGLLGKKVIFVIRNDQERICSVLKFSKSGTSGVINHVVVTESYRGFGFGKWMIDKCVKDNPDVNQWKLWVAADNLPAKTLYLKMGFECDGTVIHQFLYIKPM